MRHFFYFIISHITVLIFLLLELCFSKVICRIFFIYNYSNTINGNCNFLNTFCFFCIF